MTRLHRRRRERAGWTGEHISFLSTGQMFFALPGGEFPWPRDWEELPEPERAAVLADMAACYDQHADEIEADHRSSFSLSRSWGWWQFRSPEPRDHTQPEWFHRRDANAPEFAPEWYQLLQLGELTADECRAGTAKDVEFYSCQNWHCGWKPFRRPLEWWLFHSPTERDPERCEVAQIVGLKLLGQYETEILSGDFRILKIIHYTEDQSRWVSHLLPDERRLLGLPPVDPKLIYWDRR